MINDSKDIMRLTLKWRTGLNIRLKCCKNIILLLLIPILPQQTILVSNLKRLEIQYERYQDYKK